MLPKIYLITKISTLYKINTKKNISYYTYDEQRHLGYVLYFTFNTHIDKVNFFEVSVNDFLQR